jgi:DNA-binding NarL/FixJ family response regulator
MSIRVLLSDDHRIVREGLRTLLEKEPDIDVVAEAEDGRSTVEFARKLRPQVVVMDITMPGLNGIEATRQIINEVPGVKVLALSIHSDQRFVVGMLRAGATGYLIKDCASEELVSAIRSMLHNQTYLSPRIADIVRRECLRQGPKADTSVFSILTAREREVLQLIAEGKTTKCIASCLEVSVKTIETHRQHIMAKLNLYSLAELTKYAIREGLTSLED